MNEAEANTVSLWSCNVGERIIAPLGDKYSAIFTNPGEPAVVIKKETVPRTFDEALMVRIQYDDGTVDDFDCSIDDIRVTVAAAIPADTPEQEEPFNPERFTLHELDKMLLALESGWETMAQALNSESLFAYDKREKILVEYFALQFQLIARMIKYQKAALEPMSMIEGTIKEQLDALVDKGVIADTLEPSEDKDLNKLGAVHESGPSDIPERPIIASDAGADEEYLDSIQDDNYDEADDEDYKLAAPLAVPAFDDSALAESHDVNSYCKDILLPQVHALPPDITHVAMDESLTWYGYTGEPHTEGSFFVTSAEAEVDAYNLSGYPDITMPVVDAKYWEQTLVQVR